MENYKIMWEITSFMLSGEFGNTLYKKGKMCPTTFKTQVELYFCAY